MSLDTERFEHEGDCTVTRAERDEIEAALDAVESAREAVKELGRRIFDQVWEQRREFLDMTNYFARPRRSMDRIEAREQLAEELEKAFNSCLSDIELRRARTILETGRAD